MAGGHDSRWDTHSHRLADFTDGTGMEIFPGKLLVLCEHAHANYSCYFRSRLQ